MFVSAARRPALPLTILLLAASGCSGGGPDQLQEGAQEASQQSFEELEDLGILCEEPGEGYAGAAEYSGGGPHPTATFSAAPAADTDPSTAPALIAPHPDAEEDATPIVSWFPDSVEETVLLVCAEGHGGKEELHTCEYEHRDSFGEGEDSDEADVTLPIYSQDFSFTVYELATGEILHESDFTATNGHFFGSGVTTDCPTILQYETFPSELYAAPSAEDLHEELGHLVEGAAG